MVMSPIRNRKISSRSYSKRSLNENDWLLVRMFYYLSNLKMTILVAIVLLTLCWTSSAHGVTLEWVQLRSSNEDNLGLRVAADGLGNIYVSGHTHYSMRETNVGQNGAFAVKFGVGLFKLCGVVFYDDALVDNISKGLLMLSGVFLTTIASIGLLVGIKRKAAPSYSSVC